MIHFFYFPFFNFKILIQRWFNYYLRLALYYVCYIKHFEVLLIFQRKANKIQNQLENVHIQVINYLLQTYLFDKEIRMAVLNIQ